MNLFTKIKIWIPLLIKDKRNNILIFFILITCSCQKQQLNIDTNHIFKLIKTQTDLGPRISGSKASFELVNLIKKFAIKNNFLAEIDSWTDYLDTKPRIMKNVYCYNKKYDGSDFVLVATHFDTKNIGKKKFLSANDGGSSTALVMYLMYFFNQHKELLKNNCQIRFLFFDGEECLHEYNAYDGLTGSKRYLKKILKEDDIKKCRAFILADMISDKDLKITFPTNNSPKLVEQALKISKDLKLSKYFKKKNIHIIDDHVPFFNAGIPSINFIDFEYGENNKYWHTTEDTIDKLSQKSMNIVAQVFVRLILQVSKQKDKIK